MGLVTNYGQLLALRFCLGLFESGEQTLRITRAQTYFIKGLFPGLNFYLTAWYRREELNKRVRHLVLKERTGIKRVRSLSFSPAPSSPAPSVAFWVTVSAG